MPDAEYILKKYWGHEYFRPLQKEIIESVLSGNDTLAILPTGGGKSVCFQVPAILKDGICLVVSPLIALMKDQVGSLKKKRIPALSIHSGMTRADVIRILKNAGSDYFKFLYLSPERLETDLFLEFLPSLKISLIAIDEAHCISQWGYDFRPSYLKIADLRNKLPEVAVIALTASATPEVQNDICNQLHFKGKRIFTQSFERKNLSYRVLQPDSKLQILTDLIRNHQGSVIIYCKSRKRSQEISNLLKIHGISSDCYHAGLKTEERSQRQQKWLENQVQVIVCTNAFGMGIDKPDVRMVVHADVPDCLENYYQEAGRAGRDGEKAYAYLLYSKQDLVELSNLQNIRYPGFEKIKKVYHALVNFLQLPVNTGQYQSFTFRFHDFINNFKLNSLETFYSLKALEQDGWLEINEKNLSPSTVVFTCSKELFYELQKQQPELNTILTCLLRTYEGIFDFPVFISEQFIARSAGLTEKEIQLSLNKAFRLGIINYTPRNEEPRIFFKKNRVEAEQLHFNLFNYNKRKDAFINRTTKIARYILSSDCRSRLISDYFGDKKEFYCGNCDNCLQTEKIILSNEEFGPIANFILNLLSQKPCSIPELIEELNFYKKEKLWEVISFMQSENKIKANELGVLELF